MKIIDPSAIVIEDELAGLSIYQRIDRCASVCYQRPPKATEEEAQAFCRSMVERGHGMTLEMAQIHLVMHDDLACDFDGLKYIEVSGSGDEVVVSGSVRAFMDVCAVPWSLGHVSSLLSWRYRLFFPPKGYDTLYDLDRCRFAEPHEIPWQHQYVAVQFIINRAVSHELVRHRPCSILQESQRYCRYGDEVTFIRPEWAVEYPLSAAFDTDSYHAEGRYQLYLQEGLKPQQARAVLPNSTKTELIVYASLSEWKHIFNLRCSPAADPEMRRVMIPLREEFKQKYPEVFA
jgi:thymidylate synthase (FAD)